MKKYFSTDFCSLLKGILTPKVKDRLTLAQIKQHAFFKKVDWGKVYDCVLKAPINPKTKGDHDLKNVDKQLVGANVLEQSQESRAVFDSVALRGQEAQENLFA